MDKIEIPESEIKNILTLFPQGVVVFDLETTGLSALSDTIIEIGAIKVAPSGELASFQTLINPQMPIPARTTEIHHITDQMVAKAPFLEYALTRFMRFIEGYPLVAYNARFDVGFILNSLNSCELPFPSCSIFDAWNLTKKVIPKHETENYKLTTLAKKLTSPQYNEHRAFDDAVVCLRVLAYALEIALKKLSLNTIEESMHIFNIGPLLERIDFSIPEQFRPFIDIFARQETVEILYHGGSYKNQYRPIRPIGLIPLPSGIVLYGICLHAQMNKSFHIKKIMDIRKPSPENALKWQRLVEESKAKGKNGSA